MSDQARGTVADAGQTVQRGLNQAGETKDQLSEFIRDYTLSTREPEKPKR